MGKIWPVLAVVLLSFWAIRPLFHPGFFPVHDRTQVARVHQMTKALKDGQFPVRWVPDLGYGYGYPLFNFYAPLPYYFAALFSLLGVDALMATKIMFLAGILLSSITMFYLGKELFSHVWVGLTASVFYLYAPYHALDIYVRGAVGELWAMAFLPILALGIYKLLKFCTFKRKTPPKCPQDFLDGGGYNLLTSPWRSPRGIPSEVILGKVQNFSKFLPGVIIGSTGLAGVVLSHNIIGMLTIIGLVSFLLIWLGFLFFSNKSILATYHLLLTTLLGLGLSAFFWLPAIIELPYTNVTKLIKGGSDFRDHFVYLDQLWASPWGFAGSAPGRLDGMSFMVGKLHIIVAIATLSLAISRPAVAKRYYGILLSFTLITLFSVLMTNHISQPIWEVLSFLSFSQFPWRFLVFAIFGLSCLAGGVIVFLPRLFKLIGYLLLTALIIGYNGRYFKPEEFTMKPSSDYTSVIALQWETSKIFDEYMPPDFFPPTNVQEIRADRLAHGEEITVSTRMVGSTDITFIVDSPKDQQIELALAYFPGWQIKVNNQAVHASSFRGKMKVPVRVGISEIKATFTDTWVRSFANIISLVSLFILGGAVYATKKATG